MDGHRAACSETPVVPFQSLVYHCALLNLESIENLATSTSLSIIKIRTTEERTSGMVRVNPKIGEKQ
jgi:hypothetical protein